MIAFADSSLWLRRIRFLRSRTSAYLKGVVLTLGGLAFNVMAASAADEAISTDRPDFVESAEVVGKGRFQLETGFARERGVDSPGVKRQSSSTPTLLRFGVSDGIELRLETDGFLRARFDDGATATVTRESGFADLSLGLKWHMQDGDESTGRPAIAWLLHLDVNSGSAAFRGNGSRPSLRAVVEWELPLGLSVGAMAGVGADRGSAGGRFATGILALTVARAWTPEFRTFVELAGQRIASAKNGGSVLSFDVGAAYLLSHSTQVDVAMSRGLTRASPDLQLTTGLSIRF